jgi:hypothetical protein
MASLTCIALTAASRTDLRCPVSEKSEIKRDGAKAQKNSGRGKIQKGDASWKGFIVDYKEYAKSFSISRSNWSKICEDTWRSDHTAAPILKLILGEKGNYSRTRLGVLEWSEIEELLEIKEKYYALLKSQQDEAAYIDWAIRTNGGKDGT